MQKKTVSFTIDIDVWEAFRTQVPDRQRSKTINDFLSNYLLLNATTKEEDELKAEIKGLIEQREKIAESLQTLSVELAKRKAETEKAQEKKLQQQEAMHDSLMANNPLDR